MRGIAAIEYRRLQRLGLEDVNEWPIWVEIADLERLMMGRLTTQAEVDAQATRDAAEVPDRVPDAVRHHNEMEPHAFGLDTDAKRFARLFFQPALVYWALASARRRTDRLGSS